jgi:hypothetical protein
MLWLLSLVFSSTVGHAPTLAPVNASSLIHPAALMSAQQLLAGDARRIRSSESRLNKLMKEGVRRSRTFADLVTRVHRTDLIVYVETSHALGSDTVGRILLQTVAGGHRYLRVQVRSMLQGDQIIAVIAHELRHALEVAEDASVVDEATLTRLYRRIGHAIEGRHGYDTDAARTTGLRVREELIG